ncbi:MAG: response regulator [Desulfococcaceae bacterium]|jgi:PAS domain S-box-containing protein|nr:response regulator [Desulfococcaceae bacterium]
MKNNNKGATRILVVDDEQDIREGSQRIIKRMGCDVSTASRGDTALEILEKEQFGIMLLDLKMPGIDGMEVLRQVKEKYPEILVIIITGFATVETAIEAMKQGAYDFIPKPFEPDHLRIVVGRARERMRLRWEAEAMAKDRERTLTYLHTEKSRIRTIVESLPYGVMVTDSQGRVGLMNPAFLHHFGLPQDTGLGDFIGKYVRDEGFCKLVQDISAGKYAESDSIPGYEMELPDGKFLMARGKPVTGEDGSCLGAAVNIADITGLKELDRVKSEFVAKVSHELRSPLSTIHEQLAMVIKDMVEDSSREDREDHYILSRAKEKTQGMISLIGDLLDLSRIEAGVAFQQAKSIRIEDMLKNIADFMQARAKGKKQNLEFEPPSSPLPLFTADPVALESIFGNLVSNAVNYTPEGGNIRVKAECDGENIYVSVEDNGFGIAEKNLEKIFERFYREKNDNTRFITGTGLGLPIVKNLTEELGGSVAVKSQTGKGSCFTVRLPVHKPQE